MADVRFRLAYVTGSLALLLALPGCTQSSLRLSSDFGVAVTQDLAAQIADPDARYTGIPAPGTSGARASLAQTRYNRNQVAQPAAATATSSVQAAPTPAGNGGGGAGAGASTQ